jgi:hypothetical protein
MRGLNKDYLPAFSKWLNGSGKVGSFYSGFKAGFKMRPFRQRFVLILWAIWITYIVLALFVFIGTTAYQLNRTPDVFPRPASETRASVMVPQSIIDAYKAKTMDAEASKQFESHLRAGIITIPSTSQIMLPVQRDSVFLNFIVLLVFATVPAFILVLLQYLIVGFASPIRLFRRLPVTA